MALVPGGYSASSVTLPMAAADFARRGDFRQPKFGLNEPFGEVLRHVREPAGDVALYTYTGLVTTGSDLASTIPQEMPNNAPSFDKPVFGYFPPHGAPILFTADMFNRASLQAYRRRVASEAEGPLVKRARWGPEHTAHDADVLEKLILNTEMCKSIRFLGIQSGAPRASPGYQLFSNAEGGAMGSFSIDVRMAGEAAIRTISGAVGRPGGARLYVIIGKLVPVEWVANPNVDIAAASRGTTRISHATTACIPAIYFTSEEPYLTHLPASKEEALLVTPYNCLAYVEKKAGTGEGVAPAVYIARTAICAHVGQYYHREQRAATAPRISTEPTDFDRTPYDRIYINTATRVWGGSISGGLLADGPRGSA